MLVISFKPLLCGGLLILTTLPSADFEKWPVELADWREKNLTTTESIMNSALRNQILADRRRDRRNDILASVIGWTVTIAAVLITLPILYVGLVFIMTMA